MTSSMMGKAHWFMALSLSVPLVMANTTIQSQVCRPPMPVITTPISGSTVSSQTILVGGITDPSNAVTILDNAQPEAVVTTDSSGAFDANIPLTSGSNQLVARSVNLCGSPVDSLPVVVTWTPSSNPSPLPLSPSSDLGSPPFLLAIGSSNQPLIVPISPPSPATNIGPITSGPLLIQLLNFVNGSTTTKPSLLLSGYAGSASTVTISVNGRLVARVLSDHNGYFRVLVPLTLGSNTIKIEATQGSRMATKQGTIVRLSSPQLATPKTWWKPCRLWTAVAGGGLLLIGVGLGTRRLVIIRKKQHETNEEL